MFKPFAITIAAVGMLALPAAAVAQNATRQEATADHNAAQQSEQRVLNDRRDVHGDLSGRNTSRADLNNDKRELRADTATERSDVHDARNDAHMERQAALDRAHHNMLVRKHRKHPKS